MKIRQGFVSNSSSSSYVIIIPNNFDLDKIVDKELPKFIEMYGKTENYTTNGVTDSSKIKKDVASCILKKYLFDEENRDLFDIVTCLLKRYVLTWSETGPDRGQVEFMDQSKIEEKLKQMENQNES